MTDAVGFFGTLVGLLWVALAVAVGIWVLAAVWVVARAVSRRLERRYLPVVERWSRRRAGLGQDAGNWACPVCHSVNPPTAARCYGCDVPRPDGAPELRDAAEDDSVYHHPAPANRFDPSLYRGPGAPPVDADPAADVTDGAPPVEAAQESDRRDGAAPTEPSPAAAPPTEPSPAPAGPSPAPAPPTEAPAPPTEAAAGPPPEP